jgi:hypothetical protein
VTAEWSLESGIAPPSGPQLNLGQHHPSRQNHSLGLRTGVPRERIPGLPTGLLGIGSCGSNARGSANLRFSPRAARGCIAGYVGTCCVTLGPSFAPGWRGYGGQVGPSQTAAQDEPPQPWPRPALSLSKGRKPCSHRPLRRFALRLRSAQATTVGEKSRLTATCSRRNHDERGHDRKEGRGELRNDMGRP